MMVDPKETIDRSRKTGDPTEIRVMPRLPWHVRMWTSTVFWTRHLDLLFWRLVPKAMAAVVIVIGGMSVWPYDVIDVAAWMVANPKKQITYMQQEPLTIVSVYWKHLDKPAELATNLICDGYVEVIKDDGFSNVAPTPTWNKTELYFTVQPDWYPARNCYVRRTVTYWVNLFQRKQYVLQSDTFEILPAPGSSHPAPSR